MSKREAMPGAMKLPAGAKDRERLEALENRIAALEKKISELEATQKEKAEKKGGK